ncbi:hypothetical protein [Streptomyces sp. NPDC058657]|uniref:hypothetical protein n=1 Tax=unclassified Streptomyces TaxID=2593676 RepID=UPI00365B42AF
MLGDAVIEQIRERVAQAPEAPESLVVNLRRILTRTPDSVVNGPAAADRTAA